MPPKEKDFEEENSPAEDRYESGQEVEKMKEKIEKQEKELKKKKRRGT